MGYRVEYDGTQLTPGVHQRVLKFQSPISAIRLDVRCNITANNQLSFAVFGYASMDSMVEGLERPVVGTGNQQNMYPTTSFIKNFMFDTPVNEVVLYAETSDSPKLYVAVLDETKA